MRLRSAGVGAVTSPAGTASCQPAAPPSAAAPTDRDPPRGGDRLLDPQHRALVVGLVGVVVAVAFEAMAVATAMPVAARELGGLRAYGLAFSAFLTTSLLGMVVAGEVCDRRGPLLPFVAAAASFAAGLVLAGLAPTMGLLVLGRAVQGFGAGLNIVSLYVVVGRAFPAGLRPRVFSAIASGWVLPSVVGPLLAGAVADRFSWRLVFLGVLPLLVGAAALVGPHLRQLAGPAGVDRPARRRTGRLVAAVLAAAGAASLQYAGQRPAERPAVSLALLLAGAGLLVAGVPRLLPRGTFRLARGLPTVVALRGVLAGAFFTAEAFLPLMLVHQRGLSTTLAGASLTPAAFTWSLGAWLQGRPGRRTAPWVLQAAGFGLVLAGIALAAVATSPVVPAWLAAAGWTVAGLGMGLGLTSLSVLALELSPVAEHGSSSAALQVSDALGSVLTMGVAGAVFAALTAGPAAAQPFLVVDALMALGCVLGLLAARRVQPRPAPAEPDLAPAGVSSVRGAQV